MRAAIRRIHDRGSTNLWGGIDLARRQTLAHGREGYVNRVVVISDGQANVGISDQKGISALARQALGQGVHVTAMGVGADFDAKMMTAIAEHGGGHYYFIDDSSAMAKIFSSELQTLLATVAKSAELHLALAPGVELLDVLGYTFERRDSGREIVVHLPDIYGGLDRKVMCRLRVPAGKEGSRQLARVSLAFTDAETNARESAETVAAVALVQDRQQVEKGLDGEVMAKGEQAFAAQNLDRAMDEYERGNVGKAQAMLHQQIASSGRLNAKLKNKALDSLLGDMRGKLGQTAAVAPASEQGRMLVKAGKFRAYKAAK
jgi:Ca-activated chloride channel family protein